MKRIIKLFILIAIGILLAQLMGSCSPLKRLQRFARKHPYLFDKENDTIRISDTLRVVIPGTSYDTLLSISAARKDTLYIYKNGITTKIFIHRDSIFLANKTDTISKTIVRELKVPYQKYKVSKRPRDWLSWLPIFIVIMLFIYLDGRQKKPD